MLIDSSNTHNFIQTRVAKFLELPTMTNSTLQVMVGNDTTLPCDQLCPTPPYTFKVMSSLSTYISSPLVARTLFLEFNGSNSWDPSLQTMKR